MKNQKILGFTFVVLGAIITLLALVVLPFCKPMGDMVMRCHNSSVVSGVVAIAIALSGVLYIALPKLHAVLSFIVVALGALLALVPTVIVGVCLRTHMHCHAVSAPVLFVAGIIVALVGFANGLYVLKRKGGFK